MTEELIQICKSAMACIVEDSYTFLEDQQALSRVSSKDIRRVLKEYSPREQPVMPPDSYFEESAYMGNTGTAPAGMSILTSGTPMVRAT